MRPVRLVESVKDEILAQVVHRPLTIKDLAELTGYNYYTVRKALVELMDDGKIQPFDKGARNVRYTIGSNNGPIHIIPNLTWDGTVANSTAFLKRADLFTHYGRPGERTYNHLIELFHLAKKIDEGLPIQTVDVSLKRMKPKLSADIKALELLTHLLRQILNEEKFWNIADLERFVQDNNFPDNINELFNQITE